MTDLEPGSIPITGNMIQGVVPASLLPSLGVAPTQFGVNLWPRTGLGDNAFIADFASHKGDAAVTTTPEPATQILLFAGIGTFALLRRRRARSY